MSRIVLIALIDLPYAKAFLPVLALLLMTSHVKRGDVIYLPVPHPEAWLRTLKYVYTGEGEVSDAAKENIMYLEGRV